MEDFDGSMFLLRALAGPLMVIIAMLVTLTVFVPVVLYVIARWRVHRDPDADRHLGLKVALHYFAISAFQLGLAGLALLVWGMISSAPSEAKSVFNRVALGMIIPAGLVLGAHVQLLRRTNDAYVTGVRRLFAGYNLIVTGLLGFIALVLAFQALFAKGSAGEMGRIAGAMILVYGTAWSVLGWRFGTSVLGPGGPSAGASSSPLPPPVAAPTTSAPTVSAPTMSAPQSTATPPPAVPEISPYAPKPSAPVAAPSSGGTLPSLGTAFPPIDKDK